MDSLAASDYSLGEKIRHILMEVNLDNTLGAEEFPVMFHQA